MIAAAIGTIARGRQGSADLSLAEAERIFSKLLREDADPLQLGAFLIAERMKGESAEELAGFTRAARRLAGVSDASDPREGWVDLPCYAGKRRDVPAHLLAAVRLCRERDTRVLVHGVADIPGRVSAWQFLREVGVRRAKSIPDAEALLLRDRIAYLDLADACPPLMRIHALRARLGVRTFVHSVARLLNPLACAGQLNGVFHPPYVQRMAEANRLLRQRRSLVFMGAEGEPELYASRQKLLCRQQDERMRMQVLADSDGARPYPRKETDGHVLRVRFLSLLETEPGEEMGARIERSRRALLWAAGMMDDGGLQ